MTDVTDDLMVTDRLRWAVALLADAGVGSPESDAQALLAHAVDVEVRAVPTLVALSARIDPAQADRFAWLVHERAARRPLQHLTGTVGFRHLDLAVGPGVFIPRPETELVAGVAIAAAAGVAASGGEPRCVDLCAGSGAIALSIAAEVVDARVHAVELDDDAILWLRRNVEALGLGDRIDAVAGDAGRADELLASVVGRCDVVVSNPPYVPDDAIIRDPEVAEHDPAIALWGGPDGLDVVRRLLGAAAALLRPGGLLVLEHADVQGESVPALLENGEWDRVRDHRDLADRPRYTTAVRAGAV